MGERKLGIRRSETAGNVEHKRDERYKGVTKQPSGLESIGAELWAGEDWWIRAMGATRTDLPQS